VNFVVKYELPRESVWDVAPEGWTRRWSCMERALVTKPTPPVWSHVRQHGVGFQVQGVQQEDLLRTSVSGEPRFVAPPCVVLGTVSVPQPVVGQERWKEHLSLTAKRP
jgi:hypothetical protein